MRIIVMYSVSFIGGMLLFVPQHLTHALLLFMTGVIIACTTDIEKAIKEKK